MPYSSKTYPATGVADSFAIPFDYIAQGDLTISVNGTAKVFPTDYTFPSKSVVKFSVNPTGTVKIALTSDRSKALVDFNDASNLTELDLDTATKQTLFVALESIDVALDSQALAASIAGTASAAQAAAAAGLSSITAATIAANAAVAASNAVVGVANTANANAATALSTATSIAATAATALDNSTLAASTAAAANATANAAVTSSTLAAALRTGPAVLSGRVRNLNIASTGLTDAAVVTFAEMVLSSSTGSTIRLGSPASSQTFTVRVSVSGPGGLDTGTIAPNTWYAIWVISDGSGTNEGVLSLSPTTIPLGRTFGMRCGWLKTDGTGACLPLAFRQRGTRVSFVVAGNVTGSPILASGVQGNINTPTWVPISVVSTSSTTGVIPSTATAIHVAAALPSTAAGTVMVAPSNAYGNFSSLVNPPPFILSIGVNARTVVPASIQLETTNLYYISDLVAGQLNCLGWEDSN